MKKMTKKDLEIIRQRTDERLASATFTTDLIFKQVLKKHHDICQKLIQKVLPWLRVGEIQYLETENEIIVGIGNKRVRLDVLAEDSDNIYNLEMMTYHADIPHMIRYNQSMIDADFPIGGDVSELPDSYVIFFCTYDPLGHNLAKYILRTMVEGHPKFKYDDGRWIVIVTPKGLSEADSNLIPIIHLLKNAQSDDPFVKEVNQAVEEIKMDPQTRRDLMNLEIRNYYRDRERDSSRDRDRDKERDEQRDAERDSVRDSKRDEQRDAERDSVRDSKRDEQRDAERDSVRDSKRDEQRDAKRDSERDLKRDREHDHEMIMQTIATLKDYPDNLRKVLQDVWHLSDDEISSYLKK